MDFNQLSRDNAEDDYIDMEISSYSNFHSHSVNNLPCPKEFEFQMSSRSLEKEPSTSPADELFYKGKLLPLHLPPRLQMVEKILENSNFSSCNDKKKDDSFEEFYSTPLNTTTVNTPFESCNISPSESCQVSGELTPDECMCEYSDEGTKGFANEENPKKSWTKKFKLIKQSFLGSKLKASKTYIKSLFGKPGSSDNSHASNRRYLDEGLVSKSEDSFNKASKKIPFGEIHGVEYKQEKISEDPTSRRSFSVSFIRYSKRKVSSSSISSGSSSSSSSSSSNSLNGFREFQMLKRCNSANYEVENGILGAIAHCKQSQKLSNSSEAGDCSFSAPNIVGCADD